MAALLVLLRKSRKRLFSALFHVDKLNGKIKRGDLKPPLLFI
ncbi:hypothetical protein CHCC20348_2850 [Bacillus paralicheniformis]|nr:hypothetical protein CHCC20348_2850 [Bacillus paralicheniformis]